MGRREAFLRWKSRDSRELRSTAMVARNVSGNKEMLMRGIGCGKCYQQRNGEDSKRPV